MVSVVCYGVGTGYSSSTGCPTGIKSTFAHDEKVWACHCWTGLSGGESFRTQWQREVAGVWQTEVLLQWTNPNYYTAYHPTWIQNYPSGNWRVNFWCGPSSYYRTYFTIESALPSIRETIQWEATVPSGSHSFFLFSLYGINTNNTIGGFQIYAGTYKTATIYSPGQSRQDDLTTSNVSEYDSLTIIAENYDGSNITGIYDAWIQNNVI